MNLEAKDRLSSLVNQARGNLSKSAFAEMLAVSHTSVASWEKGTYMAKSVYASKV
jgi:DNA-binding transcriptional regulator YiaG